MIKKKNPVRQGDVFVTPITISDNDLVDGDGTLQVAEGETSGHCHMLSGHGARLMKRKDTGGMVAVVDEGGFIKVLGGGFLRHYDLVLPPGRYGITTQRGWSSSQRSAKVTD